MYARLQIAPTALSLASKDSASSKKRTRAGMHPASRMASRFSCKTAAAETSPSCPAAKQRRNEVCIAAQHTWLSFSLPRCRRQGCRVLPRCSSSRPAGGPRRSGCCEGRRCRRRGGWRSGAAFRRLRDCTAALPSAVFRHRGLRAKKNQLMREMATREDHPCCRYRSPREQKSWMIEFSQRMVVVHLFSRLLGKIPREEAHDLREGLLLLCHSQGRVRVVVGELKQGRGQVIHLSNAPGQQPKAEMGCLGRESGAICWPLLPHVEFLNTVPGRCGLLPDARPVPPKATRATPRLLRPG